MKKEINKSLETKHAIKRHHLGRKVKQWQSSVDLSSCLSSLPNQTNPNPTIVPTNQVWPDCNSSLFVDCLAVNQPPYVYKADGSCLHESSPDIYSQYCLVASLPHVLLNSHLTFYSSFVPLLSRPFHKQSWRQAAPGTE